jgi:hypothetical protein
MSIRGRGRVAIDMTRFWVRVVVLRQRLFLRVRFLICVSFRRRRLIRIWGRGAPLEIRQFLHPC